MAGTKDPTALAESDANKITSLQQDQSVASVVQHEVHDARKNLSPEDYNKYVSNLEGRFTNNNHDQICDAVRFYGTLALDSPNDVSNAKKGDTGATGSTSWMGGLSTTLGLSSSEKTQALDHLGFKGKGAPGNFDNIYGASVDDNGNIVIDKSRSGEKSEKMTDQFGDQMVMYADGSSRGYHFDSDGKPDGVNETDKDGYSRKLIRGGDGKWYASNTSGQFGKADAPVDGKNEVVNFQPPSADSDSGVGSLAPGDAPAQPASNGTGTDDATLLSTTTPLGDGAATPPTDATTQQPGGDPNAPPADAVAPPAGADPSVQPADATQLPAGADPSAQPGMAPPSDAGMIGPQGPISPDQQQLAAMYGSGQGDVPQQLNPQQQQQLAAMYGPGQGDASQQLTPEQQQQMAAMQQAGMQPAGPQTANIG